MKKLRFNILASMLFATILLAMPVQAVTYNVTMNIYIDGELIWTTTFTVEGPESPVIITVPPALYALIVERFGTDTFTSPFSLTFEAHGHTITLEVIFDPALTVIFAPGLPGDANGDGKINIYDIGVVSAHWYPGPPTGPLGYDLNADVNFDVRVDIFDIAQVSANWGMGSFSA